MFKYLFVSLQSETPESSELTSIGQFVLTAIVFVFCAMLEFAVGLVIQRRHANKIANTLKANLSDNKWTVKNKDQGALDQKGRRTENLCYMFDKAALVLFPAGFSVYFAVYVTSHI